MNSERLERFRESLVARANDLGAKVKRLKWLVLSFVPGVSALILFCLLYEFSKDISLQSFDWYAVKKSAIRRKSRTDALELQAKTAAAAINDAGVQSTPKQLPGGEGAASGIFHATGADTKRTGFVAERETRELLARMFWSISAVIFFFLCGAVCFGVSRTVQGHYTEQGEPKLFISMLLLLLAIGLLAGIQYYLPDGVRNVSGGKAADDLLDALKQEDLGLRDRTFHMLVPGLSKILQWLAAATVVALVYLALGAGSIIGRMHKAVDGAATGQEVDVEKAAKVYESLVARGLGLLQLAAAAFIAGVLEVYLLYEMSSYHVMPALQSDIMFFAHGISTAAGLVYSSLLVAIFVPLYAEQKAIGRRLLRLSGANPAKGPFLEAVATPQLWSAPVIKAALTILTPLLVGFFTKLFSYLTEHFL